MRRASELPQGIQWHEGMLLAPQHFQQLAARTEELAQYHYLALSPYHYGVRTLRFDENLLLSGVFRVLELEAVMPDGLVVSHIHGAEELELDLAPLAEELGDHEVLVQLAVPVRKLGAAQVKGDLARYRSVPGAPAPDENTGEGEVEIPRLVPRLSLLASNDPPQKFVTLPLAGVVYANEAFKATDYLPPVLEVPRASGVGRICVQAAERCREKALFLAGKVDSGGAQSGPQLLETRLQVTALVSALPALEALLATDRAHPFTLYLAFLNLVGSAAALSASLAPPVFEPYAHADLRQVFRAVRDYLFRAMDEGIVETYTPVSFVFEAGTFSLAMREEWLASRLVVGVRVRRGQSEKDAAAWMDQALIGSEPLLRGLAERRVLGAPRKRVESEQDITPPRNTLLYVIEPDPELVLPGEKLCIANTMDARSDAGPSAIIFFAPGR